MTTALPDAPATARNRDLILAVLRRRFANSMRVLEIGSGTGQHAVYFARALPHLSWQTSDLPQNHPAIHSWIAQAAVPNVLPPVTLDMGRPATWPVTRHDAIFSANTLHIASWPEVESLFVHLPGLLATRADDPARGIRDLEAVQALAADAGLALVEDIVMPANNRCLVFEK